LYSMWPDYSGARLASLRVAKSSSIHIIKNNARHWNGVQKTFANADKDKIMY